MNDLLKRLWQHISADRKKLGLMLALVAVGLLLWGRLLLRQVPRSAVAAPSPAAATASAPGKKAARPVEVEPLRVVEVAVPETLARDLFSLNDELYEKIERPERVVVPKPEKSDPVRTDEDIEAQIRGEMNAALGSMHLEGTVGGSTPRAVISGQIVAPGEQINGFVVKVIRNREVELEYRGLSAQLGMNVDVDVRAR